MGIYKARSPHRLRELPKEFVIVAVGLLMMGCDRNGQSTPAAFNLACVGTTSSGNASRPTRTAPFTQEFRIDLKANRWCLGECKETKAISSVSKTEIVLDPVPSDPQPYAYYAIRISRESGKMDADLRLGNRDIISLGSCARAASTGFPAPKF